MRSGRSTDGYSCTRRAGLPARAVGSVADQRTVPVLASRARRPISVLTTMTSGPACRTCSSVAPDTARTNPCIRPPSPRFGGPLCWNRDSLAQRCAPVTRSKSATTGGPLARRPCTSRVPLCGSTRRVTTCVKESLRESNTVAPVTGSKTPSSPGSPAAISSDPATMRTRAALVLLLLVPGLPTTTSTPVAAELLAGLRWRNLGPFRAGRVAAVSGAIGQPGVFYIGLPLGGVWKTTSAGETWYPVFDSVSSASSVGAVEVAPSDPNVIYVGMGDLITGGGINEGDGLYKSVDAGRTWQHLGLDDTRQIPSILVDPHDPNLVMIAAQGDVHKKSETRGVFRSSDGGKTWTKTLYVDDSTGLQKLAWAADHPEVVLATTVRHYVVPVTGPVRVPPAGGGGGGG